MHSCTGEPQHSVSYRVVALHNVVLGNLNVTVASRPQKEATAGLHTTAGSRHRHAARREGARHCCRGQANASTAPAIAQPHTTRTTTTATQTAVEGLLEPAAAQVGYAVTDTGGGWGMGCQHVQRQNAAAQELHTQNQTSCTQSNQQRCQHVQHRDAAAQGLHTQNHTSCTRSNQAHCKRRTAAAPADTSLPSLPLLLHCF